MESAFESRFHQLVKKLSGSETVVVLAGGFWPSPVNDMLKRYAESHDLQYVPLSDLFENDKKNAAIGLFENEGVANHPSDQGMRHIAERIMQVLRQYEYK